MKKLFFATLIAFITGVSSQAQTTGFQAGVHVGIPVGDASDASSFNIGVDAAYLFPVTEQFGLGIATGYDHFIGKDRDYNYGGFNYTVEGEDFGYIPLAAAAKFQITPNFMVGLDLGYAFATKDEMDGGFYYQPKVGYSTTTFDIYGFYKGISGKEKYNYGIGTVENDWNIGSVGVGFAYKF